MSEVHKIETVSTGAKFCKCGGMMVLDRNSGLLMSSPPKVKIYCPFCGEVDYHVSPYNVVIQFRKIDSVAEATKNENQN